MRFKHFFLFLPLILSACSSIDKRDCDKDMHELGLRHGRMGSPKKFTDEIRRVCGNRQQPVDLQRYENGFALGWVEYCRPMNAFVLGKADEDYISYCPENRETIFREKFLIGKRISELKTQEEILNDELMDLRIDAVTNERAASELSKTEKTLFELRKDIQQLEIEGLKDSLTLINHIGF